MTQAFTYCKSIVVLFEGAVLGLCIGVHAGVFGNLFRLVCCASVYIAVNEVYKSHAADVMTRMSGSGL